MRHKKTSAVILSIILVSGLCGCGAKKASLSEFRYLPARLTPEEKVVIILNESKELDVNMESEDRESYVEDCMVDAIKRENPRLNVVHARDFRKTIFAGKKFEDTPRSLEALLSFLQKEDSRRQLETIGVRYLIVVETYMSNSAGDLIFDGQEVWVLGQVSTRTSSYLASVIDARQTAESGRLSASSAGKVGLVVPVFYFIPLPPIPFFARTEAKACDGLGTAVARFFSIERVDSKTK